MTTQGRKSICFFYTFPRFVLFKIPPASATSVNAKGSSHPRPPLQSCRRKSAVPCATTPQKSRAAHFLRPAGPPHNASAMWIRLLEQIRKPAHETVICTFTNPLEASPPLISNSNVVGSRNQASTSQPMLFSLFTTALRPGHYSLGRRLAEGDTLRYFP
jgi:hypothetical protein